MDKDTTRQVDQIVEEEVRRGFRVVTLPEPYVKLLEADHQDNPSIPVFRRVRFAKLTPKKRANINIAIQRKYHKDLQNPDLLSKEQVRKLNFDRGEWSPAMEQEMVSLSDETSALARTLYLDGLDAEVRWREERSKEIIRLEQELHTRDEEGKYLVDEAVREEVLDRLARWLHYEPELKAEYSKKFAASQGREDYSPDSDLVFIGDRLPTVAAAEALGRIQELADKLTGFIELLNKRKRLLELQLKEAQMYQETVEQRRAQTEEMSRVFYLSELVDDEGHGKGPIVKSMDDLYDFPDEIIQWLQIELYFFLNNIPDEARGYIQSLGFMPPLQETGSSPRSDESLEAASSSSDSPRLAATPASSSAPTMHTN